MRGLTVPVIRWESKTLNKYSQLIGVVDALDALISERPYRSKPFSLRAAIDLLLDEAEKGRFNKSLVRTLIVYSRKETPGTKIIIGERGRDKAPGRKFLRQNSSILKNFISLH